MRKWFIFGATSSIAESTTRLFAAEGNSFFLVARDPDRLNVIADDLLVRGAAHVVTAVADARDFDRHQTLVDEAITALDGLDAVLIAHGTLPDQQSCEQSFTEVRDAFDINTLAVISLLTHAANRFERQGFGILCVIASVAGDRGRQSNYVYGAAKGTVAIFMQGLRNRLHSKGVQVLTIKPGFVDTPMTTAFAKNILWSSPNQIASGIYRAVQKKKSIVYLPWFWAPVMLVIRCLPETLFKRLRL